MSKKVALTDRIKGLIAKATDEAVDPSTVTVFECIAINTLPVTKRGTLYHGARLDAATLSEMATFLNEGGLVPLHVMHEDGILPVGRVFYAETGQTPFGESELRTLFYLPNSETELIAKVDTAVVDEVSIGFMPKTLSCCKCGFDFLGKDSTFENIWNLTCNNEHTIGEDGVFNYARGLANWMELSLVGRGAANKAKIVGRTKQLLGESEYNRLAASGHKPETLTLFATATKEPSMDIDKLIGQLSDAKATSQTQAAQITGLQASITALTAERDELKTANATLAAKETPDATKLAADLTAEKATSAAMLSYIRTEADRLALAAGLTKPVETADLAALQASIDASRAKLSATLPVGGAANGAGSGSGTTPNAATSASSFKTTR